MQCNSPCYCLLYIDCQLEFSNNCIKNKGYLWRLNNICIPKVLDCEMVNPSVYVICIANSIIRLNIILIVVLKEEGSSKSNQSNGKKNVQ